jgi:hypothetical protein
MSGKPAWYLKTSPAGQETFVLGEEMSLAGQETIALGQEMSPAGQERPPPYRPDIFQGRILAARLTTAAGRVQNRDNP